MEGKAGSFDTRYSPSSLSGPFICTLRHSQEGKALQTNKEMAQELVTSRFVQRKESFQKK